MDMVRRAYIQSTQELPGDATAARLHQDMVHRMVRWIKLRVYSRRDWPTEFGEYPKTLEAQVKD